jgi:hypothetical protein
LPRNRRDPAAFHASRMRKLLGKLRICTNLTSSRSSAAYDNVAAVRD